MTSPQVGALAAHRNRRLRSAIVTSLVSKAGSLLVQVVALPLAIAALGANTFGAYASTVAGVSWVTLVSIGAGPSLTRLVSVAIGQKDQEREVVLFANGLCACLVAAAIATVVLLCVRSVDLARLLGPAVAGHEEAARTVLLLLSILVPLTITGGVADAMFAAHQEQATTNMWAFVLSLISVPLYLMVRRSPSMAMMAAAAFGPTAATKLAGLVQLVGKRSFLLSGLRRIRWSVTRELLLTGGAFALISAGSYLNTQVAILAAGRHGARQAAQMAVLVQMSAIVISVAVMINNTLWPALIEAKQRGDGAWLRKAIRVATLSNLTVAGGSLLGLGLFTGWVASRWYKVPLSTPTATSWAMGAFMAAAIFENMLISISFGVGSLRRTALIFLGRTILAAGGYMLVAGSWGITGILLVGAVTALGACVALAVPALRETMARRP
jgi:O-antigen/teichoic acid export membrane protein